MRARQSGFTLIELMVTIGIVAALAAIAFVSYNSYVARARASEIVLKYVALRTGVGVDIATDGSTPCAALAARLEIGRAHV